MAAPRTTDDEFISVWNRLGSAVLVARELQMATRAVMSRRASIENRLEIKLEAHNDQRKKINIIHSDDKIRSIADIVGTVIVLVTRTGCPVSRLLDSKGC